MKWDDEGHPYWIGYGNGQFSTYSYSGLGQRSFYHDASGVSHSNTFSGDDPADNLLSDGTATYTPGISEHRASDNATRYSLHCITAGHV